MKKLFLILSVFALVLTLSFSSGAFSSERAIVGIKSTPSITNQSIAYGNPESVLLVTSCDEGPVIIII